MAMRRLVCALAFLEAVVPSRASLSLMQLITNADLRIESRNKWAKIPSFASQTLSSPAVQSLLSPYFQCPWSLHRSNFVDEVLDGGKWTCGIPETVDRSNGKLIVYSFGSAGNDIFERHIQSMNPDAEIHVFDPTSEPLKEWNFHEIGVCSEGESFTAYGKSYPCTNLEAHMRQLGHTYVDVLKMDVEGAEWGIIAESNWTGLHVGQLLIELHDFGGNIALSDLIEKYIGRLETAGYLLFSTEPVCEGCSGQYEFAFVHRQWRPSKFQERASHIRAANPLARLNASLMR